jgi:hypothetical protein
VQKLAEDIFNEMDQDKSGSITRQEFVQAYFSQSVEVSEEIEKLTRIIMEDEKRKKDITEKLEEIRDTERTNAHGLMEGSVLTVKVIEARELELQKMTGGIAPYVVMSIEG